MKKVSVSASTNYDILIEKGLIKQSGKLIADVAKSRRTAIVTDSKVNELYTETVRESLINEGFEVSVFVFPNGEKSKCLETLNQIYCFLSDSQITRTDTIIALGGGVVGDITGFAAATFLRGIDYVQIPTTLLAQVDSSVGGKTAIDMPFGKNLVGAFKQPSLVICDPSTLDTLLPETFSDGMGEVIKYGMIRDEKLFETLLDNDMNSITEIIDEIIYKCVSIKRDVVEEDEKEASVRAILNFGHTIGHAIENYYHYETYTHGSAVAMGMCIMSSKTASDEITEKLIKCVEKYNLPSSTTVSLKELVPICKKDKKMHSSSINYIVCEEIGKAKIIKADFEEFRKKMEE
jgi:3-dehydroquinate synthase